MRLRYSLALGAALGAPSLPLLAADLNLKVELPRIAVAEYHKPYVAVWLEKAADQSFAGNLAVWYDLKKRDNGGAKWLKDMRSWWRKSGRDLQTPIDGVTAATRAPGEHVLALSSAKGLAARRVFTHVVKNSAPQILTVLGLQFGFQLGGSVLVEAVFSWPGTGYLLNLAIFQRDIPVLQGVILVLATFFVLLNLTVDLLQTLVDPRIARH